MKSLLLGLLIIIGFVISPISLCVSDGWSMYPKLPPYNVNLIQEIDYSYPYPFNNIEYVPPEIHVGDTVLAYSPRSGRLITHDVIAINDMGYELKGFNGHTNPVADGYVQYDAIVGKVLELPFIGVPIFVNLSVFIVCFGFVTIFALILSAHHDRAEEKYRSRATKQGAKFEDAMLFLVIILFLSIIFNSILIWRMIM